MPRRRYSEGTLDTIGTGKQRRWRGYWFVYVGVDGREVRRKREKVLDLCSTMTKIEARNALVKLIQESRGELPPAPQDPTVAQLWDRYCAFKSGNWSKGQRGTLNSVMGSSLLPAIGNARVSEVTLETLQKVLNAAAAKGRSKSYVGTLYTYAKSAFKFGAKQRPGTENVAEDLAMPKIGVKKPCKRFLSPHECRSLIETATGRDYLILRLLIVAGVRSQELFLLRANDVEDGCIRVDEAFKRKEKGAARIGTTKTDGYEGVPDTVPITRKLRQELRDWIRAEELLPMDLLFRNSRGGIIDPHNYLTRELKDLAVRAGVGIRSREEKTPDGEPIVTSDITFQAFRRTTATYFRKDVKGAQRQLRHAKPDMTAAEYQQVITDEHRESVENLEKELCERKVVKMRKRA
jgi:integrase